MDVLIEEARCARSAKNVSENAKVFLCVAWSSVEEIRLFKCFPEVIYCDATADTNNTKNQLVTFTGRTTSGRQFIFLRIWIHNQRKSTFQWIFKVVLRTFIPNRFFQQVRVCLVDGDPQQHFNLIQALKTYLHNAVHSTCAYHLVSGSWKRHCPSKASIDDNMKTKFDEFGKHVNNWVYSFMRPGYCETQQEYDLSKRLLYAFVRSPDVRAILGSTQNVRQVDNWLRDIIFVKENQFLYIQRKHIRYYYQMTTSPHEGTNFGMKSHAAKVQPSHTMVKSGRALSLQSSLKMGQLRHESTAALYRNSLWANEWTSKHLITKAESIIQQTLEKSKQYSVNRTSEKTWQVFFSGMTNSTDVNDNNQSSSNNHNQDTNDESNKKWSPIPIFNRNRIVKLDANKTLRCSCFKFESTGLACHHIASVISYSYPDWKGFSHHDCGLEWWKIWHHYAYNPQARRLSLLLSKAKSLPITGPSFPSENRDPPPVVGEFHEILHTPILQRIRNYDEDRIKALLPNNGSLENSSTTHYEGLSQSSNILQDEDGFDTFGDIKNDNLDQIGDLFSPILNANEGPADSSGTMFDRLKHNFYELLNVLETHNKEFPEQDKCNEVLNLLQSQTNSLRKDLIESSRKRSADDTGTVNIMSEARPCSTRRKLNSKNC